LSVEYTLIGSSVAVLKPSWNESMEISIQPRIVAFSKEKGEFGKSPGGWKKLELPWRGRRMLRKPAMIHYRERVKSSARI